MLFYVASYAVHHGAIMCVHECTCMLQVSAYLRTVTAVIIFMVFIVCYVIAMNK